MENSIPLLPCLTMVSGVATLAYASSHSKRPSKVRRKRRPYIDSLFLSPIAFVFLMSVTFQPKSVAVVARMGSSCDAHEKRPAVLNGVGPKGQALTVPPASGKQIGASWRLHVTAVQLDGCLKARPDFLAVQSRARVATKCDVLGIANSRPCDRLGLIASRKFGNAVRGIARTTPA